MAWSKRRAGNAVPAVVGLPFAKGPGSMAQPGFKLYLVGSEETDDEPREILEQIGDIFPDWTTAMEALHAYYASHGGADEVRRRFKGGIRVEWLKEAPA